MPFAEIKGHAHTIALLKQAVRRGRLPQSLLFAGPAGVGKHAVAIALAQAVNCPARRRDDGDDACGKCPTCVRIAGGRHSDVVLLDKGDEASIKIRALRERVLDIVGYRPFEAEKRVFIIDPADELTLEAQDALLKTLEEPPPSAILILVSAYPDTLVPTVQSRCRRLRFGAVPRLPTPADDQAADDREAALMLLRAARGRAPAAALKAAAAFSKNSSDRRDREALGDRLAALGSLLRDLGAIGVGADRTLANADVGDELRSLATAFGPARASAAYETTTRAAEHLDRNASPKIVADWIALSI